MNGGVGFDHNAIFGSAWTPRVSVAAYLRKPSPTEALGDTKLTFNAGKGIKEPNLSQELSSLYDLLPAATANSLGLQPIGPERSRSVDAGIEQGLAGGHARIRARVLRQRLHRPDRVPQPERAAAARHPAGRGGRRGGELRRLRQLAVEHVARRRTLRRSGRGSGQDRRLVHLRRCDGHQIVEQRRAEPRDQPRVSEHPDRRVLAARRRASVPAAGQFGQPRRPVHEGQGAGVAWPATSSASATTARS